MNKSLLAVIAAIVVGAVAFFTLSPSADPVSSGEVYAKTADFSYETYTQEAFDALLGNEPFVVFVHSTSCGTCAKKHQAIIDDVSSFGGGTLLKMDYDTAPQAFLSEYGVTKYDTFVVFDKEGNAETKAGATVDAVRATYGDMLSSDNGEEASVFSKTDSFTYQTFDEKTFEELKAGDEAFSLFFFSKSCGTCAKKHAQIMGEKTAFTGGTILQVDYNEAPQALLKEFSVTKYDTFVTFDKDGNVSTNLGGSVEDVREALNA